MAVLPRFAKWSNRRDDSGAVYDEYDFSVLAATHREGVATYHGSRRRNGDRWTGPVGAFGTAHPVAGIGAPRVMAPPPTTAVEVFLQETTLSFLEEMRAAVWFQSLFRDYRARVL